MEGLRELQSVQTGLLGPPTSYCADLKAVTRIAERLSMRMPAYTQAFEEFRDVAHAEFGAGEANTEHHQQQQQPQQQPPQHPPTSEGIQPNSMGASNGPPKQVRREDGAG
eukprot:1177284-Amphidinium_carterae.1